VASKFSYLVKPAILINFVQRIASNSGVVM
jgi:hypothetical protein